MSKVKCAAQLGVLWWCVALVGTTPAQAQGLTQWLEERAKNLAAGSLVLSAAVNQSDPTKETESPTLSTNSDAITDGSAVPDVIAFAFKAFGVNGSNGAAPPAITITPYALRAYASGVDPLDPAFYHANRRWRDFAFKAAYDSDKGEGDANQRGLLLEARALLINQRVATPEKISKASGASTDLQELFEKLGIALSRSSVKASPIIVEFFHSSHRDIYEQGVAAAPGGDPDTAFRRALAQRKFFTETAKPIIEKDTALLKQIDASLAPQLTDIVAYGQAVERGIAKLRMKPQLALLVQNKRRQGEVRDDYLTELTFDRGFTALGGRLANLTLNASYGRKTDDMMLTNKGARFAAEYEVMLKKNLDTFDPKGPKRLSFGAEFNDAAEKSIRKAQLKLVIPLRSGITLPISVTAANRREFIQESKVRGRVGLTVDFGKLDYGKLLAEAKGAMEAKVAATLMPTLPATATMATAEGVEDAAATPTATPVKTNLTVFVYEQKDDVLLTDLRGLPGAVVTVEQDNNTMAIGVTDSKGKTELTFDRIPGQTYQIRVALPGYTISTKTSKLDSLVLNVPLQKPVALR